MNPESLDFTFFVPEILENTRMVDPLEDSLVVKNPQNSFFYDEIYNPNIDNMETENFCCTQQFVGLPYEFFQEEASQERISMEKTPLQEEKEQKPRNFASLANRNLKLNFGTGLLQYLEFKKDMALWKNDNKTQRFYEKIIEFILGKQSQFVSFSGWRSLLRDKTFGKELRKICRRFFGKSFVQTYIQFAKIKQEYKETYVKKVECFLEGAKNPGKLAPAVYNNIK